MKIGIYSDKAIMKSNGSTSRSKKSQRGNIYKLKYISQSNINDNKNTIE
jgi:hypothetical protein